MSSIYKIKDSNGNTVNTIVADAEFISEQGYSDVELVPQVQVQEKKRFYTKLEVLRQMPKSAVKVIISGAKNDADLELWKYLFERSTEIDRFDQEFLAGIAALKTSNILPANWELT